MIAFVGQKDGERVQKSLGNSATSRDNSGTVEGVGRTSEPLLTSPREEGAEMADQHSSKSPAFQFYPNDFLSDANVIVMSLQERGAYITLICVCWQQGSLPSDVAQLARFCGSPVGVFRRLWPAIEKCFKVAANGVRLTHPRLDKERKKQAEFRRRQSDKGKASAAKRATAVQPDGNHGSTAVQPSPVQPEPNSSIFNLQSSSTDFGQVVPLTSARSKRPIFTGSRLTVFEWMLDDLRRMLGAHVEAFDLHEWFFALDGQASAANIVIPQRDGGKWLQEQTLNEAIKRGLPVAASAGAGNPKTAGNQAAAARFVARGQQ
jgi:uncharacterized protein YdaU (DUF1376 family)